jgi:PAS domain S-box-containing protein
MSQAERTAGTPFELLDAETTAAIVEAASMLIVVLDPEARILSFNAACERATGFAAADLIGQPVWRLIPDDQLPDVEIVFGELRDTGRSNLHENDWLTRSGARRRIAWSNTAVRDAAGAIARVIATGIDVTDLRAAERQRHESDARLAGIVHSAMDAILTVDEAQRIAVFNPAAEKMFGRTSAQMIGQPLDVLIPERFRTAHPAQMARFAQSGQTSRRMGQLGHVWGMRANGEEFPIEAAISQTRSRDGVLLSVILRDVSERETLQQKLRQSQELAALATLVTGIAHDIGTPMNVILGYTDMLARSARDEKSLERIRIVKEQVERVTRLIQTLMNFARPQHETPRLLRIEDVVERGLGLITETARKRAIAIERAFGDTAPILAQGERLERAFLDLFVNACDAMPDGGKLRVITRPLRDGVEIAVEDTGIGIAADALERIFEPFYTTKPRGKGTGLGLLVTRSIVLEHGGAIDVESELGKGTIFLIRLPRDPAMAKRGDSPAP